MGACFDRLRCEVFQNLFLSPMNTGFVRPAVATVLTVYGIETINATNNLEASFQSCNSTYRLRYWNLLIFSISANMLNLGCNSTYRLRYWNKCSFFNAMKRRSLLQQYLPFTVLKLVVLRGGELWSSTTLQQYLPFTVLKLIKLGSSFNVRLPVATVLTVYGIETIG